MTSRLRNRIGGVAASVLLAAFIILPDPAGAGGSALPAPPVQAGGVGHSSVSTGGAFTCSIVTGGKVSCWGANNSLQIGSFPTGYWQPTPRPVIVPSVAGAAAVVTGSGHACALVSGGQVWCWGSDSDGQLGDGSGPLHMEPSPVPGVTGATAIAAGESHACAVVGGGQVRCWGDNLFGQLGNGSTTDAVSPVTVTGLTGATAISAGGAHTCAVVSGGTVRCWGSNGSGQLGDGTTTQRTTPVTVSGFTGVLAVDAGSVHTCAVVSGGTVRCWGRNTTGQLGDGTTTQRTTPVAVSGLTGATQLSSGGEHTCAVVSGGTVRCWGRNTTGQLGDGTTTNRTTPVSVTGLTGATRVAASTPNTLSSALAAINHTCAVVSGGTVRCWGSNGSGQLGDGTTTNRTAPVAVVALDQIAPTRPTSLAATVVGTSITLSWGGSDDFMGGSGVRVYRVWRGGVFVRDVPAGERSVSIPRGAANTTYEVAAIDYCDNASPRAQVVK